jgi:hypothetical protein
MSGCANIGDVVSNFFRVWNASSRSAFQMNFSSSSKDQCWVWKSWRSSEQICDSSPPSRESCGLDAQSLMASNPVPLEPCPDPRIFLLKISHDQELNFAQPELALAKLRIKLMITQSRKHNAEMLFMLFLTLRIDQDDVNKDHAKLVQLFHENRVYEVSGGVGQTKRHHQILVPRFRGGEKPMTRIGTGYLDPGEENQDS